MGKQHRREYIKWAALILVPIIMLALVGSIFSVIDRNSYLNSLYAQGEIVILKDKDFTNRYSFQGTGTAENPFLIENYIFDDPNKTAIVIRDTTMHFVIRNCSIKKRGQPLFISNIGFNTGTLINNTFINNLTLDEDVRFYDSRDNRNRRFFTSNYTPFVEWYTFIVNAPGIRIENNLFRFSANRTANFNEHGLCLLSSDNSTSSTAGWL